MKNLAVIGSGAWGMNLVRKFHELGVLKRVADVGENNFEKLAKDFPDLLLSQDYQDCLEDEELKAVAIATPPVSHYELAREFLLAGRCVWVEKPMALNTRDAEELVKISKSRGIVLMVGHILLYQPALVKLKSLLRAGALGQIYYINARRLNFGKVRKFENVLWSLAPHDISSILYLLEEMPEAISCAGEGYIQKKVEDMVFINLFFKNNIFASINVSWLDPLKDRKLIVVGSKRMAVLDESSPDEKLKIYNQWVRVPKLGQPKGEYYALKKGKVVAPVYREAPPLDEECRHFIDCFTKRRRPRSDGSQGLQVVKILSACDVSLKNNGKRVEVDEQ